MGYPQTSAPNTTHSVFYSHSISINGLIIGSFEKMSVREARQGVERIREILFSRGAQVKEIVWGGVDITIDLSRVEMYQRAVFEAMGVNIFTLEDLNQPLLIQETQENPTSAVGGSGGKRVISYHDCVASDKSKDIDIGTTRIIESMTFQCRTVTGFRE